MKFDKITAVKMRDEINQVLKQVGEKYGIDINAGNCTFGETEMTYKLKLKTKDQGVLKENEERIWNQYHTLYGMEKSDLGKTFNARGEVYKITGLEIGRSKYSLKVTRQSDGKNVLFVAEEIAKLIHPKTAQETV